MESSFEDITLQSAFLGRGFGFPPTFDPYAKEVEMIEAEEDIKSSLGILLATRQGERVMQPTYGCNLDEMLFQPLDTSLKTYMKDLIQTAILYHEPRIEVLKITLRDENELEGVVLIEIDYLIRATNSRHNYVYPFYKIEGTEI